MEGASDQHPEAHQHPPPPAPPDIAKPSHPWRKWVWLVLILSGVGIGAYYLIPTIRTMLETVSTDDAYVNGPSGPSRLILTRSLFTPPPSRGGVTGRKRGTCRAVGNG